MVVNILYKCGEESQEPASDRLEIPLIWATLHLYRIAFRSDMKNSYIRTF